MPKVIIPKKDLPPISANDNGYNIRLRLISQDRNRSSFWTPLYSVSAQASASVTGIVHVVNVGGGQKIINVVWSDTSANKEEDIFVAWTPPPDPTQTWTYIATTTFNNYTIIPPPTATSFLLTIQNSTYPKQYNATYAIFTTTSPITI